MSEVKKLKVETENRGQMQETQMQRPPNSVKVIPLDGPNKGVPTYQQFNFDSRVQVIPLDGPNKGVPTYQQVNFDNRIPQLIDQLDRANYERNRLITEISQYKAEGRVANTTYNITCDKNKWPGINSYCIKQNDDFMHVCKEIGGFQAICRVMLKAHIGKTFLDDLIAYLAEPYLGVSKEEVMSKINRAGDATDSVTTGIRTIRELILMFDDQVCENIPRYSPEFYAAKIRQLASCMNLEDYEIFFIWFTGEIYTDARVYHELKANTEFSSKLSQFQLDFQFASELFLDYPMILNHDTADLISFLTAVQHSNDIVSAANIFRAAATLCMSGDLLKRKTPATLDDSSCDILEFCLENGNGADGVSAKAMMDHIKEESKSRFSKVILKPLRELGYLRFSCPDSHSSRQRYCITSAGVTALRKARPGRTYPEPIQTDSDTVSAVPNGKKE